eukprot:gene31925-37620_t
MAHNLALRRDDWRDTFCALPVIAVEMGKEKVWRRRAGAEVRHT